MMCLENCAREAIANGLLPLLSLDVGFFLAGKLLVREDGMVMKIWDGEIIGLNCF